MKHHSAIWIAAAFLPLALPASAQSSLKSAVPGTYTLSSVYDELADGKKNDTWGAGVKGSLILTPNGHFSVTFLSARDKAASNTPRQPAGPMITYYGTYSIDEPAHTITYHIVGSSFPAWEGIDRVAALEATSSGVNIVTTVKDDKQLGDLKAHQEWKRE
jgi:hypothetical protein